MVLDNETAPRFFLCLAGERDSDGGQYSITLGPWTSIDKAVAYSAQLTDTRIGEQLLDKLGVKELHAFEG
jgi:hypothetical protein